MPGDSSTVGDGSVPDAAVVDGGVVEECADPDGPVVQILSPEPAADPNTDAVIIDDRVTVTCSVTSPGTPGSRPIATETVSIVRLAGAGGVADAPAVTAGATIEEYEASFDLSEAPPGPISFRCTANDMDFVPRCGVDQVDTLLDHGPNIVIGSPEPGSIHGQRMNIVYNITAAPITEEDMLADVGSHSVIVAGQTVATGTGAGDFEALVDFEDRMVYPEPLVGNFVFSIRAGNQRTPSPGIRELEQTFTVDSEGPNIEITSPSSGGLIGGLTTVSAIITDAAGVDPSTVVIRIGTTTEPMTMSGGDTYRHTFDASAFASTITELTINITADDVVGNRNTASVIAKLDSTPPIASLDPPWIREGRVNSEGELECSASFDPVGWDSVNDGQVVGTVSEFRARVQDAANRQFGGSGTVAFFAGLDDTSVKLYILDDVSTPLLVDETGDGTCDAINPMVEPALGMGSAAVVVNFIPIDAAGDAFFPDSGDMTATPDTSAAYAGGTLYSACVNGVDATSPALLCPLSSPLTRVIPAMVSGLPPTVYAKEPVTPDTCVGDAFDFQSSVSEGWACAAIQATDHLGNVGISPPIRVCFTDGVGADPCPGSLGTIVPDAMRPNCTDMCAPPFSYADVAGPQLIIPEDVR